MADLSSSSSPATLLRDRVRCNLDQLKSVCDAQLIEDTIILAREALALSSESGADRVDACLLFSSSLRERSARHADDSMLDQIINLERQALGLCEQGHIERARCCEFLASSLRTRYRRTSDNRLLDEAVDLGREALSLHPKGHPDRSLSCGNLASSLRTRYQLTGDVRLLDEAIDLGRDALDLCPEGHLDRPSSCANLANSLWTRYELTGNNSLLDEAIDLGRESLSLRPEGHPDHSLSCGNLAISLRTRYKLTGDVRLLDEAIDLQRESLDICPEGHPDRSLSCANLASSLWTRYKLSGDADLLDEAIDLGRESLELRPEGHPDRHSSCGNLAISLWAYYYRSGDKTLLHDIFILQQEAVAIAPMKAVWRHLTELIRVYLEVNSPLYSVNTAIKYLSQALENEHDDIQRAVNTLMSLIDKIWYCDAEGKHVKLITIYQRLVNLLPLLAHPALGVQPQLQAMKGCALLGSDAFVNATLAGDYSSGLEPLELAQSVIWSQSLHRRDPQLKDVPEPIAARLQEVLYTMVAEPTIKSLRSEPNARTTRDELHANSSRLYALLKKIRALPGLDRFMLGETFETLLTAASDHPVVVLVGARGHYYALVIASSFAPNRHTLLSLDWTEEDANHASLKNGTTISYRGGEVFEYVHSAAERLSLGKDFLRRSQQLDRSLKALWLKIVKPVLDHLGLQVSDNNNSTVFTLLISVVAIARPESTPLALVSHWHVQLFTVACGRHLR
jgi:hypothetical protein